MMICLEVYLISLKKVDGQLLKFEFYATSYYIQSHCRKVDCLLAMENGTTD